MSIAPNTDIHHIANILDGTDIKCIYSIPVTKQLSEKNKKSKKKKDYSCTEHNEYDDGSSRRE